MSFRFFSSGRPRISSKLSHSALNKSVRNDKATNSVNSAVNLARKSGTLPVGLLDSKKLGSLDFFELSHLLVLAVKSEISRPDKTAELETQLYQKIRNAKPGDLALLWGVFDRLSEKFRVILIGHTDAISPLFSPRQFANIILNIGKENKIPGRKSAAVSLLDVGSKFLSAAIVKLPLFESIDLGQLAYGLGKLKHSDDELTKTFVARIGAVFNVLTPEVTVASIYYLCRCSSYETNRVLLGRLWEGVLGMRSLGGVKGTQSAHLSQLKDNQLFMLLADFNSECGPLETRNEILRRAVISSGGVAVVCLRHHFAVAGLKKRRLDESFFAVVVDRLIGSDIGCPKIALNSIETRDLWEIKNLLDGLLNGRFVRDRDLLGKTARLRKMVGETLLVRRQKGTDLM